MKKCVNGKYVEMTEEEILEMQKAQEEREKAEAMRPPTTEERLEAMETAFMEFVEVMMNG